MLGGVADERLRNVPLTPYYEDAAVRLYHGDCRAVLPELAPVDHLISDPPFSSDVYLRASAVYTKAGSGTPKRMGLSEQKRRGGALQKMANGDIGVMDRDLMTVIGAWATDAVRRWVVIFSDVESCHHWRYALEHVRTPAGADHVGLRYLRTGAWVKPNAMPQMSGDRPAVGFEPCIIAHAQMRGNMRWNGGGKPAVWIHNTASGHDRPEGHPCPKPEALMRDLVLDFTDERDVILDPFSGSGTTGVAAKRLGRRAVLIECEKAYCKLAAARLEATVYEPALLPSPNLRGKQGDFLKEQPA